MRKIYWLPILGLVLILTFEIIAAVSHLGVPAGEIMTISQIFWWVSGRMLRNLMPFGFGLLMGHLFLGGKRT